jgi:hypothetical protein
MRCMSAESLPPTETSEITEASFSVSIPLGAFGDSLVGAILASPGRFVKEKTRSGTDCKTGAMAFVVIPYVE